MSNVLDFNPAGLDGAALCDLAGASTDLITGVPRGIHRLLRPDEIRVHRVEEEE